MNYFALISLFLLSTCAYIRTDDDEVKDDDPVTKPEPATDTDKNFNSKLDGIIKENLDMVREEITPVKIENKLISFNRKVALVNVTGSIGFENITLTGLDTIKRVGDSYLAKTKYGNTELQLKLSVGPLTLKADGLVQFMGLSSKSTYELTLESVDGSAVLHFYPKTEEIFVKSGETGKLNGLKFRITKSPLIFTPLVVNQVSKASIAIFKPALELVIHSTTKKILEGVVKNSDFLKDIMTKYGNKS